MGHTSAPTPQTSREPYRILVGVDFSETATRALDHALDLAGRHEKAEVHLACVVDDRGSVEQPHGGRLDIGIEDVIGLLRKLASERLAALSLRQKLGMRVFTHVRVGAAVQALLGLSDQVNADLIVVGTHGRSGFQRLWLGSVAERLVRFATCPVVAVRPKDHRPEVGLQPEPACHACAQRRAATEGREWWCEGHATPPTVAHPYQYSSVFDLEREPYAKVW